MLIHFYLGISWNNFLKICLDFVPFRKYAIPEITHCAWRRHKRTHLQQKDGRTHFWHNDFSIEIATIFFKYLAKTLILWCNIHSNNVGKYISCIHEVIWSRFPILAQMLMSGFNPPVTVIDRISRETTTSFQHDWVKQHATFFLFLIFPVGSFIIFPWFVR